MAPPAVALARANGAKVKMVSVLYQKIPIAVFSLNPGANVTTAKQLEGLTLGSGSGSFTPKILAGYMAQQGLDPNSLRIVNIAPSARASALMAKTVPSIEFFLMSRPGLEAGAKDNHAELKTFFPADHGLELYSNGVGASEDYLAANPDIVKRFMRAALKGWKFALDNPDKAVADEIKLVPTLIKPDVVRADFEIVRDLVVTPDSQRQGLGWFDPAKIKSNLDFVVKYIGINGTPPAATDLYALGYLPDPPIKP
jgi:NitT/TauT family transport system substrate-binding protein